MKLFVTLIAGLLAWSLSDLDAGGFVLGCLAGYLFWQQREAGGRLRTMEDELAALRSAVQASARTDREPARVAEAPVPVSPPPEADVEVAPVEVEAQADVAAPAHPAAGEPAADEHFAAGERSAADERSAVEERFAAGLAMLKAFVFGGNTLVRAGLVVLFFGLAFLVKYAVDHAFFPVSLRLASAAAAGVALTGIGWRLRMRRPEYALTLQGGGAAVLYLAIFAAFRLYDLLPAGAAFALLVATTALCAALALLQDARTLAVLSLLGGFFAPVLASTGEGSHVLLFGYYAVLNAGVVALAWFRAWRIVHLVGFFCTFGIAALWVADAYAPEHFATTEPFLAYFFVCYFVVAVLHARHRSPEPFRPVDGTLVFGLPVVVFSLQSVLVESFAYGLAWSAFAFGAFYAAAAYVLYRRSPSRLRLLVESFAGVGLAMGTMVLPFALDATWTGTGWALEGAALVWLGFRQRRVLLRLSGMLLQAAAAVAFLEGADTYDGALAPVLNRVFFGCLALSLSALATAYLVHRRRDDRRPWEAPFEGVFLAVGLLWWLGGGVAEITRVGQVMRFELQLVILFVVLTALACAALRPRLSWPALRVPAVLVLPAVALLLVPAFYTLSHPFAHGGFVTWPLNLAAIVGVLRLTDTAVQSRLAGWMHAFALWLVVFVVAWEGAWALGEVTPAGSVWPLLAYGLTPVLAVLLVARRAASPGWPVGVWHEGYLLAGALPLLGAAWYWSVYAGLASSADPSPLPYLPLANPVDVTIGMGVAAGVVWYRTCRRLLPGFDARFGWVAGWAAVATVFFCLNATLARTVHAWAGVPYDLDALLASTTFQTALTIFWTLLSVTTMAVAARRGGRTPWMVAAGLLGVTVVKLFVVDLSSIGTIARIVTFIVVGLLLLVVGYVAPVPPQKRGSEVDEPDEPVRTPV